MAGNLISTLLYYQEEGQLRTPYEVGQAVSLYAYDISLFDFAPNVNLKLFAQKRAFIKTIMKFKDIWDADTKEFVLNTQADIIRFNKIKDALKEYDPDMVDMPKLFKDIFPSVV